MIEVLKTSPNPPAHECLKAVSQVWTLIGAYFNPAMRNKATTCRSTACSSRNTSVSQPLETQISTTHQKQPVPMCQSHVDARFPMERSASTKIRNPSVTLHKQACTMLSKWSVIWVGNTFRKVTRDCYETFGGAQRLRASTK